MWAACQNESANQLAGAAILSMMLQFVGQRSGTTELGGIPLHVVVVVANANMAGFEADLRALVSLTG